MTLTWNVISTISLHKVRTAWTVRLTDLPIILYFLWGVLKNILCDTPVNFEMYLHTSPSLLLQSAKCQISSEKFASTCRAGVVTFSFFSIQYSNLPTTRQCLNLRFKLSNPSSPVFSHYLHFFCQLFTSRFPFCIRTLPIP